MCHLVVRTEIWLSIKSVKKGKELSNKKLFPSRDAVRCFVQISKYEIEVDGCDKNTVTCGCIMRETVLKYCVGVLL